MLHNRSDHAFSPRPLQSAEDIFSHPFPISKYNVPAGLDGLGLKLHTDIVKEMADAYDVRQFLLVTKAVSNVVKQNIQGISVFEGVFKKNAEIV